MLATRLRIAAQALAVTAVAGLLALLVWKVTHQGGGAAAALGQGKTPPAPNFTLPLLNGPGKLRLSSLRGKAVVVNFWASWCVPCKQEAPRLEAAYKQWSKQGVVFVGVDAQDFSSDARSFARRYGLTYPLVHDGPGQTLGGYGVTGFPETYFVRPDGRLVGGRIEGAVTAKQLDQGIRLALGR